MSETPTDLSSETVLRQDTDGVRLLTLNRPTKRNAFSNEQWRAFGYELNQAKADESVGVVVVTGAGDDFSAGADLTDFSGGSLEEHPFHGAAKGVAVGGGATFLFHCDVVYVGESLRMRLPFVSLGLVPELASSYLLQANIGARRAAELFYTAEWIGAERAVETGIATRAFSDAELVDAALGKAAEMAQWPVRSLQATKRTLKTAHQAGIAAALEAEDAGMLQQAGSPENVEAIMAFLEKRPPKFR
jgi:enoyl-CoA hydratase/carnithine racemase